MCTFQPGNFTSCGSEGVKQQYGIIQYNNSHHIFSNRPSSQGWGGGGGGGVVVVVVVEIGILRMMSIVRRQRMFGRKQNK